MLVTGASRGIGRGVAMALAQAGANLALNYFRDATAAESLAEAVRAEGVETFTVQGDLHDLQRMRALFDLCDERLGGLDGLVLNAAGNMRTIPFDQVTEQDFEQVFTANARGFFFAMQEAARRLRDGGAIVSMSSGGVMRPGPGAAPYNGAKAALEYFTAVLAREIPAARRITVNTVMPGVILTEGLQAEAPPAFLEDARCQTPLGRLGEPADIAGAVVFLLSDAARFVTGQRIVVNGGLY